MTDDNQPAIWVKVVESHAIKTWMGLVLVVCSGLSLVILTLGAVWPTFTDSAVTDISQSYLTLLGTNLGVIFGGIIGFLSGESVTKKKNGETISEGDLTLKVDPPPPTPHRGADSVTQKALDPATKARLVYYRRIFMNLHQWRALMEDHGMEPTITLPTGEVVCYWDLLTGLSRLGNREHQAFSMMWLFGCTSYETRDVMLPGGSASVVRQYADTGMIRILRSYDAKQHWTRPDLIRPPFQRR